MKNDGRTLPRRRISLVRATGLVLALALSTFALPPSADAIPFCYCEMYCADGNVIFGQAQTRYQCIQAFNEYCGGSGTWVCGQ